MESTKQIFRTYNFKLLCDILDKDFGDIVGGPVNNPNEEVFNQKIKSDGI